MDLESTLSAFNQVGQFFNKITTEFFNLVASYPFFAAALFLPLVGSFAYFVISIFHNVDYRELSDTGFMAGFKQWRENRGKRKFADYYLAKDEEMAYVSIDGEKYFRKEFNRGRRWRISDGDKVWNYYHKR